MRHIFGFNELARYMNQLNDRLARALREGLKDVAEVIEKAAKENIIYGRSEWPRLKKSTILARIRKREAGKRALRRIKRMQEQGAPVLARASVLRRALRRARITSPFKPLYDTGNLLRSIKSVVEDDEAIVGSTVEYAAIHEFGGNAGRGRRVHIPARPYLRPAAEENLGVAKELFVRRIEEAARRRTR